MILLTSLLLAGLLLMLAAKPAAAENSIRDLKIGKMSLGFNPGEGFVLEYDGASIIKESSLFVIGPGWSAQYYGYGQAEQNATIREIEGGKEAILTHHTSSFEGEHRLTMLENKLISDFRYQLTTDVTNAMIEFNLGYISAPLIAGCPFEAETADGVVRGVIPASTTAPTMEEGTLLEKPFTRISIESRIGKLTLDVSGYPSGLYLLDTRGMSERWAERNPIFWLGALHQKLNPNEEYNSHVEFTVEPAPAVQTIPVPEVDQLTSTKQSDLRVPTPKPPVIIPEPKQITLLDNDFVLNEQTRIVVSQNAQGRDLQGAQSFAEELKADYGISIPIVRENEAEGENLILVGEPATHQLLQKAAAKENLSAPEKPEGYSLLVTPEHVLVLGNDPAGSFYGMQTLKQLVKSESDSLVLAGCRITDYPSLSFRGAHLFIGNKALPFHKKLISRIFSRFKMNHLILEADYLKWDSAPEIAIDFSMSKDDLREDIHFAKDHFMEVSPLVQSLGHLEWAFNNGQNLEFAEDKSYPYAYCPSNPKSYEFIFKLYDEAVDLYENPKYFHIGHDEVTLFARFPNDDECKKKTVTELVLEDIHKIHEHLSKKGVRIMLWGDMFIGPGESPDACSAHSLEEAAERREQLPKDAVIADWHYIKADPEAFKSPVIFKEAGFDCIASTWMTPGNIQNFTTAVKRSGGLGLLQTTWSGYNSHEGLIKTCFDQYAAFVLAAEYAWNSGETSLEQLPYRYEEEFRKRWEQRVSIRRHQVGSTFDLSSLANASNDETLLKQGWLGIESDEALVDFPKGTLRLEDDLFELNQAPNGNSVIRLAGALDRQVTYPISAVIPINQKLSSLLFLHTCSWPDKWERKVGSYRIQYEDGTSTEIDLIYGETIGALSDLRTCPESPICWKGKTKLGKEIALRQLEWTNPMPDKLITQVEFCSERTDAGLNLLAISSMS